MNDAHQQCEPSITCVRINQIVDINSHSKMGNACVYKLVDLFSKFAKTGPIFRHLRVIANSRLA